MKKRPALFGLLLLSLNSFYASAADTSYVKSPDGLISFKLFSMGKQLSYSVNYGNAVIIAPSPIVMELDGYSLTDNAGIGSVERYNMNETYPWLGVHSKAVNKCNGAKFLVQSRRLNFHLELRVFNDGIAFRQLIVPQSTNHIPDEATVFNLPSGASIWYHDLYMHYEGVHVKKQIDQVQDGEWVAPPATFKLENGIYGSITEAALVGYSGMALQANGKNGLVVRLAHNQPTSYPYRLRYSAEDTARLRKPAVIKGKITTPWRVVLIGKNLNVLVNSDIINNLNPPPDPKLFPQGLHTAWIKPGPAVWKYLNGGGDGNPEVMKHFTDGAAALGFKHNILEGFWNRWTDEQLKDLVDYSRKKGVGIWLWKHSKSLRNAAYRDSFFKKCNALGIAGLKIDFFDHEAKEVIDLYENILKETAKYHLMVDFHGANKPTGLARTYPNELTCEAVKGMESSKLMDRATHETTIPFTRLLAGPAEYTVVHFGERRKNTTWTHQVASAAILSAPLLTYAANPDTILANPAADMIRQIPAVWDETIVLPPSEIGELAVYARRKGTDWFLAIMNGVKPKKIKVALSFLKGKNFKTAIITDDPVNSASELKRQAVYSAGDVIEIDLVPGGGYIAKFSK